MSPELSTIQKWHVNVTCVMFNHGMSWHLQRPARPVRRFLDGLVSTRDWNNGIHPISPSLLEALSLAWQSQICEAIAQPGQSQYVSHTGGESIIDIAGTGSWCILRILWGEVRLRALQPEQINELSFWLPGAWIAMLYQQCVLTRSMSQCLKKIQGAHPDQSVSGTAEFQNILGQT